MRKAPVVLLIVASLCLAGTTASAQKVYRWVDSNGVVHYGDHVPPEFANRDRDLLNNQAISVGFERGELSAAEIAERDRLVATDELRRKQERETAQRDQVLLDTYLSVSDIEELRDRRIELLESQMQVTEQYLGNLRKRMRTLEREAARYSEKDDGDEEMPENLALELSRTIASIDLYEENLERTRLEKDELREAFAMDIARFRQLKSDTL
jgi:Domain of unknown function (DUF4124)